MIGFIRDMLARRQSRKTAKEVLRHALHVRHMRGDVLAPAQSETLREAEAALRDALRHGTPAAVEAAVEALHRAVDRISRRRRFPALCENVEIVVVAIVVAMGFRTYFLQPFKIPTGSMEPTLFGIHIEEKTERGTLDRFPLNMAKWLVTGQMYREIRARGPGQLTGPFPGGDDYPVSTFYTIGARRYKLPRSGQLRFAPGDYVPAGAVLWSGTITAGDHVFVNKIAWNLRRPRRGEIMVFSTGGIRSLQPGTHYIKRMAGLPNETVGIRPPMLLIDGNPVLEPESIRRIAELRPGYHGYVITRDAEVLASPFDRIKLGPEEYFALGDNTRNSRDGRYWGAVPRANLVGPATCIYWPISPRWGLLR